jgi:hypothetical protein
MIKILCKVSGGVTGTRTAYLKSNGVEPGGREGGGGQIERADERPACQGEVRVRGSGGLKLRRYLVISDTGKFVHYDIVDARWHKEAKQKVLRARRSVHPRDVNILTQTEVAQVYWAMSEKSHEQIMAKFKRNTAK